MCQFFNSVTNQTSLSPNDEPEINVLDLPYYAILTLHSAMANVEISLNEGRNHPKISLIEGFFHRPHPSHRDKIVYCIERFSDKKGHCVKRNSVEIAQWSDFFIVFLGLFKKVSLHLRHKKR